MVVNVNKLVTSCTIGDVTRWAQSVLLLQKKIEGLHPPQGVRAQADLAAKVRRLTFVRIMTALGSCLIRLIQVPGNS